MSGVGVMGGFRSDGRGFRSDWGLSGKAFLKSDSVNCTKKTLVQSSKCDSFHMLCLQKVAFYFEFAARFRLLLN